MDDFTAIDFDEKIITSVLDEPGLLERVLQNINVKLQSQLRVKAGKLTHDKLRLKSPIRFLLGDDLIPYTADPTDAQTIALCENLYQYEVLVGYCKTTQSQVYDRLLSQIDWSLWPTPSVLVSPSRTCTLYELKTFFKRHAMCFRKLYATTHWSQTAHCCFCHGYWKSVFPRPNEMNFAEYVAQFYSKKDQLYIRNAAHICFQECFEETQS